MFSWLTERTSSLLESLEFCTTADNSRTFQDQLDGRERGLHIIAAVVCTGSSSMERLSMPA